ncbi:MAG: PfkB family carbohydrate kinase [Ruthenibacterium lactatiformans]
MNVEKIAETINGLQHIGLPTNDLEKTVAFYEGLGFSVALRTVNEAAGEQVAFLQLKELMIEAYQTGRAAGRAGAVDHIALDVADVDTLFVLLRDGGYELLDDAVRFLPFGRGACAFSPSSAPMGKRWNSAKNFEEESMFDIVALGESLIDFTPSGENSQGMALFARNPGGAPQCAGNGRKAGRQNRIYRQGGDDAFGAFLKKTMEDAGVDVRGLRMTREYPTTLAFVQLTPEGDRSFTFYRKPGADVMLAPAEVDRALLRDCRIFHFGSVSLTDEPCRTATLAAAREAIAAVAMISYDPNYRPFLWDSAERAREALLAALPLADIVKVSEEEMELLTGEVQLAAGADALASRGAALVLVTLGPRGAYYRAAAGRGLLPACEVDTVDTTGAGDAFLGALLSCLAGKTLEELRILPQAQWERIVAFANAAGSLTTAAKGAIPAMPAREQILRLCGE